MHVHLMEWILTLAVTVAVLLFDVLVMARRSGEPTMRRSVVGLSAYSPLSASKAISRASTPMISSAADGR